MINKLTSLARKNRSVHYTELRHRIKCIILAYRLNLHNYKRHLAAYSNEQDPDTKEYYSGLVTAILSELRKNKRRLKAAICEAVLWLYGLDRYTSECLRLRIPESKIWRIQYVHIHE